MDSTLDIGFLFENYYNNIVEFFTEKMGELQAFSDYQAQQIEALTQKLVMMGILVVVLILAVIILAIALKLAKGNRQRRRIDEAEARLRREEMRLREQRRYYEEQNRQNGYDDYGYRDDKYGHGEYRDRWSPKKPKKKRGLRDIIPEGEPKDLREKANRETEYYGDMGDLRKDKKDQWF